MNAMVRDGRRRKVGQVDGGRVARGNWNVSVIDGMGSRDTCRVDQGRRVVMAPVMRSCDEYHVCPLPPKEAPRLGYLDGDEVARSEDVYHRALEETKQGGTPPSSIPMAGGSLQCAPKLP